MSKINIKMLSESALDYINLNLDSFTKKVIENDDNSWLQATLPGNCYIEKVYKIDDFTLEMNPDSKDKDIDFKNGITLYENLHNLPRYILTDIKFWLWLILDKFYKESKSFMKINTSSTVGDHWSDRQHRRRAIFFNVLARLFFRVERTIEDGDLTLTKWVFENPERFRNLSWRALSDNKKVVIQFLRGCKHAVETTNLEYPKVYQDLATWASCIGGSTLLDAYDGYESEKLENVVFKRMVNMLKREKWLRENLIKD